MNKIGMAVAVLFCSLKLLAAMPEIQAKGADVKRWLQWNLYTRGVLLTMFPAETETIDKLYLGVVDNDEPEASAMKSPDEIGIEVNTGLLKFVRSEDEYKAVMAHEMAHILLKHRSAGYWVPKPGKGEKALGALLRKHPEIAPFVFREHFERKEDFALLEKQDEEADKVAVDASGRIGVSSCVFDNFMRRLYEYNLGRGIDRDAYGAIMRNRIRILDKACASEKIGSR